MPQESRITVEAGERATVLEIRGDVTMAIDPLLNEAYEEACREKARRILFKFEESAYIDSGGIAALLQVLVKARENGQKTALSGLSRHNRKMLNMVGVTRLADIYDTAEIALSNIDNWK